MRHIGTGEPYRNLDDARRFLDWAATHQAAHGFCRWAVIEKASGNVIGSCGFARIESLEEIELGYLFDRRAWGHGFATEAARACLRYGFESLKFPQVVALTNPRNSASQHVLEKIGFASQGIKEVDGYEDIVYLAINPEQSGF
jgi:RimJ/RimL family protein N-acetyltransferase